MNEWTNCLALGLRISGNASRSLLLVEALSWKREFRKAIFVGENLNGNFTCRRWRTTQATRAWSWQLGQGLVQDLEAFRRVLQDIGDGNLCGWCPATLIHMGLAIDDMRHFFTWITSFSNLYFRNSYMNALSRLSSLFVLCSCPWELLCIQRVRLFSWRRPQASAADLAPAPTLSSFCPSKQKDASHEFRTDGTWEIRAKSNLCTSQRKSASDMQLAFWARALPQPGPALLPGFWVFFLAACLCLTRRNVITS